MKEKSENKRILKKIYALQRQRKDILSLPSEKVLDTILLSPEPAALVHSFSEEDLHFLIHDIGPEDAVPLIALASYRQWEYMVDVEVWEKDRLSLGNLTRWFELLLHADPHRLTHWILQDKKEFFEFFLFKNIEVRIREHDQDPSELGDSYFTYDDVFYIRFINDPRHAENSTAKQVISRLLDRLADTDYNTFQALILEYASIIPSETEEEEFRLRNVRLAEKGFSPYYEALGIYQPISKKEIRSLRFKSVPLPSDPEFFSPVPLLHTQLLEKRSPFVETLRRIRPGRILNGLQSEFAGLCNQLIAADQKCITHRQDLKAVVNKAAAIISIGLSQLSGKKKNNIQQFIEWVQRVPLLDIFRVGYGTILELKWKAEKWKHQSWFERQGLTLSFWGEDWMGVLGGLLVHRPMYFDNYQKGVLYREFYSMEDIDAAEKVLNNIIVFDALLARMNIRIKSDYPLLTYKRLILTLWARYTLNLEEEAIPMTLEEFKRFFNTLWSTKAKPYRIRISMKESLLNWLASRATIDPFDISTSLGDVLEDIFIEIEEEFQDVNPADLKPKYILLFLVQNQ